MGQEETVEFNELTYDKVFLLSNEEAEQYFVDNKRRKCKATEFAKVNGALVDSDGCSWWWLRSPHPYNLVNVFYVLCDGDIRGNSVDISDVVTRPALWINL